MKNNSPIVGLDPNALAKLQELKRQEDAGEVLDPHISEALKAISVASKVVNAIMSGSQIDPVFFKKLSDLAQERIQNLDKPQHKKVLKKKKKLKRKST